MNLDELLELLGEIPHPAIDYSLVKLGILTDVKFQNPKVSAIFAFPFPIEKIPIADRIIDSVAITLENFNISLEYETRVMTETKKELFLTLEKSAWRGL